MVVTGSERSHAIPRRGRVLDISVPGQSERPSSKFYVPDGGILPGPPAACRSCQLEGTPDGVIETAGHEVRGDLGEESSRWCGWAPTPRTLHPHLCPASHTHPETHDTLSQTCPVVSWASWWGSIWVERGIMDALRSRWTMLPHGRAASAARGYAVQVNHERGLARGRRASSVSLPCTQDEVASD